MTKLLLPRNIEFSLLLRKNVYASCFSPGLSFSSLFSNHAGLCALHGRDRPRVGRLRLHLQSLGRHQQRGLGVLRRPRLGPLHLHVRVRRGGGQPGGGGGGLPGAEEGVGGVERGDLARVERARWGWDWDL